jgi:TRAP-type mannitol/chloroaromatic compound transport system substrate-binding protein
MDRRQFLSGGATAGSVAFAAPALAAAPPELVWNCASAAPAGAGQLLGERLASLTDGRFQLRLLPPEAAATAEAVREGQVECAHVAGHALIAQDPTFAFEGGLPFGLNRQQRQAWLQAGGREVLGTFHATQGLVSLPASCAGTAMGGWFRREIRAAADLAGLRCHLTGLGADVLRRLGAVPQRLATAEVMPALAAGRLDAAAGTDPAEDEAQGLHRAAPFYYYPGWAGGGATLSLLVTPARWATLPLPWRDALETACRESDAALAARRDARSPAALQRLLAAGTQLRAFPREVLEACYRASFRLYAELAEANPAFRRVYEHWKAFREEALGWFRLAEGGFDSFVYYMHAREQPRR